MISAILALSIVVPFGTSVSPLSGSVVSYEVYAGDPNKGAVSGPFYFEGEPIVPKEAKWAQALPKGSMGWHDGIFPVIDGKIKLDKEQSLGSPVYNYSDGRFVPAYWFFWNRNPYGTWNDLVWGKSAITITGNRLTVNVKVYGSPWQSVDVIGNDNVVTCDVRPGTQSRLIQDLASVRVRGDRNTVRGYVEGQMCAVWLGGKDNRLLDLTLKGGSLGDDSGLAYTYGDSLKATNVIGIADARLYPVSHSASMVYLDNRASNAVVYNCTAMGFFRGVFSHGGSNIRVERFKSMWNGTPVVFAPFYLTPSISPTGNTTRSLYEVK